MRKLPLTSNIVERFFFSQVKLTLSTHLRYSMLPSTLEMIMFLKLNAIDVEDDSASGSDDGKDYILTTSSQYKYNVKNATT